MQQQQQLARMDAPSSDTASVFRRTILNGFSDPIYTYK